MVAQTTQTIDVHAHILTEETIRLLQSEAPKVAPKLSDIDDQFGTLDVAGSVYRHFPRGGWDLERRLQDMAASKVDVQVLSVCPQTFVYAQPPALAAAFARIQNEQLAKLVKARPDRFLAIGTLPMQAPKLAADELRHAVRELGLRGAQIGSNIAGKNLDDPELEPVWATAAELDAFILLHPINVAGMDRLSSYYLNNLIGNPLDTTIAAACLVFSGVLERHPTLKICLSHGGGFVPYQAGRFVHGWHVRKEPKKKLPKPPTESLNRFFFDTIVHSKRRAGIPGRQCGCRPRAARQRLSLRHGHAGRRAAGPKPVDPGRRADLHPGRAGRRCWARRRTQQRRGRPPDAARIEVIERRRRKRCRKKPRRTPGATRAGPGEYVFDLAKVNHILGGPDYSTANGACVEGDRMIVGLMRMPAGTGAEPHSHPERAVDLHPARAPSGRRSATRRSRPSPARWSTFRPTSSIPARRRRARCGVLHRQGRLAQPARHQGRLNRCSGIRQRKGRQDRAGGRLFRLPGMGYNQWEAAHLQVARR